MIWVFSNSDDISVPDGIVWLLNANEKCGNKSLVSKNKKKNIYLQPTRCRHWNYMYGIINWFCVFTGNHESVTMNQMYGFEGEVKSKYP